MNHLMYDAYERGEMESSADTGRELAFVDSVVDCDWLFEVVACWRHLLQARRAEEITGRQVVPQRFTIHADTKKAIEDAIAGMFTDMHLGEPFAVAIEKALASEQDLSERLQLDCEAEITSVRADSN